MIVNSLKNTWVSIPCNDDDTQQFYQKNPDRIDGCTWKLCTSQVRQAVATSFILSFFPSFANAVDGSSSEGGGGGKRRLPRRAARSSGNIAATELATQH